MARAARLQPNANFSVFIQGRRDGPSGIRVMPGHVGQGGGSQSAAGPELTNRFQDIRLARTIGAPETNRSHVELEVEARMAAKIGEAKAGKGGH